eukprot:scaffold221347_cov17-Tisochrysis_lutea.AAC.2
MKGANVSNTATAGAGVKKQIRTIPYKVNMHAASFLCGNGWASAQLVHLMSLMPVMLNAYSSAWISAIKCAATDSLAPIDHRARSDQATQDAIARGHSNPSRKADQATQGAIRFGTRPCQVKAVRGLSPAKEYLLRKSVASLVLLVYPFAEEAYTKLCRSRSNKKDGPDVLLCQHSRQLLNQDLCITTWTLEMEAAFLDYVKKYGRKWAK